MHDASRMSIDLVGLHDVSRVTIHLVVHLHEASRVSIDLVVQLHDVSRVTIDLVGSCLRASSDAQAACVLPATTKPGDGVGRKTGKTVPTGVRLS